MTTDDKTPLFDPANTPDAPDEPVNPEVQAQRDREERERQARADADADAQRVLREREEREAERLSEDQRTAVSLNQRVDTGDEAVFLASTGHNTADE